MPERIRQADAELVLGVFRQARNEVTEMVHAARGDDRRETREALLHVAFRLEVLERDLGVRLGVAEPGQVTDDVLRRLRQNAGPARHRAKP